jgi:hypothetical protein
MGLARAGRSEEHHVLARLDEVEGTQMGDHLPAHRRLVFEVEVLEALPGREAGGLDARLTTVALPRGDLALETRHEILLVAPRLAPRPLGEPPGGVEQGGRLECSAQVREIGCRLRGRAHDATSKKRS